MVASCILTNYELRKTCSSCSCGRPKGGAVSRFVPELAAGSGVVTTRGHVHWVVTEYGAVNLHGKTLRERAALLISVAHPDFRGELKQWAAGVRHYVV